jgi:acetylornithine deacetylase
MLVDDASGKIVLFSSVGDNPILTFSGHTDTVPSNDSWSTNPFVLEEKDEKLYGLGACDMKGGIASFLAVVSHIDYSKLKRGISLLFTFDEEINFEGISHFINQGYKPSKYVIIPEPTEMKPIIATKGCVAFKIIFKGVSSHSSCPDKGISAILMANEFINNINEYCEELKKHCDNKFDIPYATMNIGKISGGDAINKVPDKCILDFEFRTIDASQTDEITKIVYELAKNYDCEIIPQLSMDATNCNDLEFIRLLEKLSESKSVTVNYVTEASLMQKSNCNVILLGPGPMNAHITNEFVNKTDLIKLAKIFENVIEHFCY